MVAVISYCLLFWVQRLVLIQLVIRAKRTRVETDIYSQIFFRCNNRSEIESPIHQTHQNIETTNEIICDSMQQQSAARKTYHYVAWVFMYLFKIS